MHEFGLTYTPDGPRRRSRRPLVRVLLFLVLPLAYYLWVIASFTAADRRLVELDAEIVATGVRAERAERLLKRMAAGAAEDAPLVPAELLAPPALAATREALLLGATAEVVSGDGSAGSRPAATTGENRLAAGDGPPPLPAGTAEIPVAAAFPTLAELSPRTWPATAGRSERYAEAAAEARFASLVRRRGIRAVLAEFRALPEIAAGEAAIADLSVGRGREAARRVSLALEAGGYDPLRRLLDRIVADPRFRDLAVRSASREGAARRVEVDLVLVEGGGGK